MRDACKREEDIHVDDWKIKKHIKTDRIFTHLLFLSCHVCNDRLLIFTFMFSDDWPALRITTPLTSIIPPLCALCKLYVSTLCHSPTNLHPMGSGAGKPVVSPTAYAFCYTGAADPSAGASPRGAGEGVGVGVQAGSSTAYPGGDNTPRRPSSRQSSYGEPVDENCNMVCEACSASFHVFKRKVRTWVFYVPFLLFQCPLKPARIRTIFQTIKLPVKCMQFV